MSDLTFALAVAGMALASYACRIGGFLLMGYVPLTPRVEAALRAMPLAVMVGIATPAATSGSLPEIGALIVAGLASKLTGKDVVAAVLGAATVALLRFILRP